MTHISSVPHGSSVLLQRTNLSSSTANTTVRPTACSPYAIHDKTNHALLSQHREAYSIVQLTGMVAAQNLPFPSEIVLRILEYSTGAELKIVRLVSKALKSFAEPLLFQTFYLFPHRRSFDQLLALSETPLIRQYVRKLCYDLRWSPILERILQRMKSVYTSRLSTEEKNQAIEAAKNNYLGDLTLSSSRSYEVELMLLCDAFPNLTSLEAIQVIENSFEPYDHSLDIADLPYFYAKLRRETCGAVPEMDLEPGRYLLRGRTSSGRQVLLASRKLHNPLKSFENINTVWQMLLRDFSLQNHHHLIMPSLKDLERVVLRQDGETIYYQASHIESLDVLSEILWKAKALVDLQVHFGLMSGRPKVREGAETLLGGLQEKSSTWTMIKSQHWATGLVHLDLTTITCLEEEMESLLTACAPTLRHLALGNIYLLRDMPKPRFPCFVRVLKFMQAGMNLVSLRLHGVISNGGNQNWRVTAAEKEEEDSLLTKVCRFVIEGGDCPLEAVAVQPSCNDVVLVHLRDIPLLFDESWSMIVSESDEDLSDEIDEEDLDEDEGSDEAEDYEDSERDSDDDYLPNSNPSYETIAQLFGPHFR